MDYDHTEYGEPLHPTYASDFVHPGDQAWVEYSATKIFNGKVTAISATHIQLDDMDEPAAFVDMVAAYWDEESKEGYLFRMKSQ